MDAKTKLAKAKTNLVLDYPFWGSLALNMHSSVEPADWFESKGLPPTACVSHTKMVFCEQFLDTLDDQEVKFLVAHEVMHPAFDHIGRLKGRDPKLWNMAGDYVINQHLVESRVGTMPQGGLLDQSLFNQCGGVTDNIYATLQQQQQQQDGGGNGDGKGPLDQMVDDSSSQAEATAAANDWKIKIKQAVQAAKMVGNLPAGIARLVEELVTPKVDWRNVLQNFLVRCKADERSYARPNRRFLNHPFIMPSVDGEAMGELVVAIDCSGSVGDDDLRQFASELNDIKANLRPRLLHVLYFDTKVSHYESYGPDDNLNIAAHGGGGTRFSPVFEYIEREGIEPVATVFLTDLCCYDFGEPPMHPVLWVSNGRDEAPFGEVVMM